MSHYNVIHTEDDDSTVEYVGNNSRKQGLTYHNANSLNSLESLLLDNSADVWLVDGKFAVEKGALVEYLAPQAIQKIRERYPLARILLYSGEDNIDKKAAEYGVDFFRKGKVSAREIVENIKKMIGEQLQV